MGGLNSAGIYTNLASFYRVLVDGLQGLHFYGSDPVSRIGHKYQRSFAGNNAGFHPSSKRRRSFRRYQKPAGTGDELQFWLVY